MLRLDVRLAVAALDGSPELRLVSARAQGPQTTPPSWVGAQSELTFTMATRRVGGALQQQVEAAMGPTG